MISVACEDQGSSVPQPRLVVSELRDEVPERVKFAFNFIALCNQSMGLASTVNNVTGGLETVRGELHHKQEQAFRIACDTIGLYLSGALYGKDGKEGWTEEAVSSKDEA